MCVAFFILMQLVFRVRPVLFTVLHSIIFTTIILYYNVRILLQLLCTINYQYHCSVISVALVLVHLCLKTSLSLSLISG